MIALVAAALAAAQPAAELDCEDPRNQAEMNQCEEMGFQLADGALNVAWREVIAQARRADADIDRQYDRRPTSEARLREAQRAWIVFRDAHCEAEAYLEARGGSMEPMIYEGCRSRLTIERTTQLRALPVDQ